MGQQKFITIYEALKADILQGHYGYREQLPSEPSLANTYDVSRETVRKALNMLSNDGKIQKIKGKGSVVIYQGMTEFPLADLRSFKEVQAELGRTYDTEVKVLEIVKALDVPTVKHALDLTAEQQLWHVVRLRHYEHKTKTIDEDYFLTDIVPNLTEAIARDSIYDYIEHDLGRKISYSNKTITFEPFSEQEYQYFGEINPPYTATVRGVVYLENTTKFQYNISKHLATEFQFNDFSRRRPE